jgi:hypothetical protein
MSIVQKLFQLLSSKRKALRPYEADALVAIKKRLSLLAQKTIEQQLARFAFVQRLVSDKEVNLYFKASNGEGTAPTLQSPFSEWPIGIVYFSASNSPSPFRATVYVANAQLFSIVFSRSPIGCALSVSDTQIILDPFHHKPKVAPDSHDADHLIKGITQLLPNFPVRAVEPPLDVELRTRFLIATANSLPHDFSNLLSHANGCYIKNWRINGLPLREVPMEGANLFVLAESESQLLCAKDGDGTTSVYLWNMDEERESHAGSSFESALSRCVNVGA